MRFSSLPLLAKILLSTSVAITALFAITGEIVLRNITHTVSDSVEAEVHNSFQAYTAVLKSRTDLLASVSRLLSVMQVVRLAAQTGDRATIEDTAAELWSKVSDAHAIFLVTDPKGKILASLGGVTSIPLDKKLEVVQEAERKFPEQSSGFLFQNG